MAEDTKTPEANLEGLADRQEDQMANTVSVMTNNILTADARGRDAATARFFDILTKEDIQAKVGDADVAIPVVAVADLGSAQIKEATINAHLEYRVHQEQNRNTNIESSQEGGFKSWIGAHVSIEAKEGISSERKRSSDMTATMDLDLTMSQTEAPEGQLKLQDLVLSKTLTRASQADQAPAADG